MKPKTDATSQSSLTGCEEVVAIQGSPTGNTGATPGSQAQSKRGSGAGAAGLNGSAGAAGLPENAGAGLCIFLS